MFIRKVEEDGDGSAVLYSQIYSMYEEIKDTKEGITVQIKAIQKELAAAKQMHQKTRNNTNKEILLP